MVVDDQNEDLKRVMGSRLKGARQIPGSEFQPGKAKLPERPKPKGEGGTPAPFPIIPQAEIPKYLAERAKAEEPFAGDRTRTFDPTLNEFALKSVAQERGITVEELLKQQGRKLETKVSPFKEETTQDTELLDLEMQELELKKKTLERKKQLLQAAAAPAPAADPVTPVVTPTPAPKPVLTKKPINPVLAKMREKLSLERLKPASVTIGGIEFELLPPPTSTYPWIFSELSRTQGQAEEVTILTLKQCTAALVVVKVEGQPIAEVLGLCDEGSVQDPLNPPTDLRILTAQSLLEMFRGEPTLDTLFRFNPDMADKLYKAFNTFFKDLDLVSSLDPKLRHFICPVLNCDETYDIAVEAGIPTFCQIHGVPMEDHGLSSEVKSLPLL